MRYLNLLLAAALLVEAGARLAQHHWVWATVYLVGGVVNFVFYESDR